MHSIATVYVMIVTRGSSIFIALSNNVHFRLLFSSKLVTVIEIVHILKVDSQIIKSLLEIDDPLVFLCLLI